MSQPHIDPERLAALLDGRLDARAREALLAELARDDDTADEFADVAALVRDMERDEHAEHAQRVDAAATPLAETPIVETPIVETPATGAAAASPVAGHIEPAPARRRGPARWWIGLAAALVVAVIGRGIVSRDDASSATYVALLGGGPRATVDAFAWDGTRGTGDALTAQARAVRFGVRLTELELARRDGDRAAAAQSASEASTLLAAVPGGGPIAVLYQRAAVDSSTPDELRTASTTSLARLGADDVRAGAWLAAARDAAARHDRLFFRDAASRRGLDALRRRVPGEAAPLVERLDRDLTTGGEPPWDALARTVEELLATLGR